MSRLLHEAEGSTAVVIDTEGREILRRDSRRAKRPPRAASARGDGHPADLGAGTVEKEDRGKA